MDNKKVKQKKPSKLEQCEKLRDEYLSGWKRAKADYENYRKAEFDRSKRQREGAEENCVSAFLQVYENLEKAKQHFPDKLKENEWASGVIHIEKQFLQALESFGLEEIKADNKEFNPELHEAVEVIESKEFGQGIVIETIQKGYKLNGKVMLPAKVKVSN